MNKIVALVLIPLAVILSLTTEPEPYVDIKNAPLCCVQFGGDAWLCCLDWLGTQATTDSFTTIKGDYR